MDDHMKNYKCGPREEIQETIEYYILTNKLKPHEKLPSEREMADMWKVNRTTLHYALKQLISRGVIYSKAGSGNYVAEPKIERCLQDLKGISEFAEEKSINLFSKVISFEVIEANKKLSKKLHTTLGSKVFSLTRLRFFNNEPCILETSYLNKNIFEGLEKYDFSDDSLYRVIEEDYGIKIFGGDEEISITSPTEEEAQLLAIPDDSGIFLLSSTIYDQDETPIEYVESLSRADKITFASMLRKKGEV